MRSEAGSADTVGVMNATAPSIARGSSIFFIVDCPFVGTQAGSGPGLLQLMVASSLPLSPLLSLQMTLILSPGFARLSLMPTIGSFETPGPRLADETSLPFR